MQWRDVVLLGSARSIELTSLGALPMGIVAAADQYHTAFHFNQHANTRDRIAIEYKTAFWADGAHATTEHPLGHFAAATAAE